jgi:segregation and condensation protein A
MFEVRHEYYAGPMEKLLALVEERHLEISRVSLAQITGDFIAYVEQLGESATSSTLSEFIVVAARLLVIKSKELIPSLPLTEDEESDIVDLEHRLKIYREFSARGVSVTGGKNASQYVAELWNGQKPFLARPFLSGAKEYSFFYPSKQITAQVLRESLEQLLKIVEGLVPLQKTVVSNSIVSLQEKMNELTARLQNKMRVSMKGIVSKEQKHEVIVMFLAVLHLLANRLADVEQEGQFGEITVTHKEESLSSEQNSV